MNSLPWLGSLFLHDDHLSDLGGGREKLGVERNPARGRATAPFPCHGPDMDFHRLDPNPLCQASTSDRSRSLGITFSNGVQSAAKRIRASSVASSSAAGHRPLVMSIYKTAEKLAKTPPAFACLGTSGGSSRNNDFPSSIKRVGRQVGDQHVAFADSHQPLVVFRNPASPVPLIFGGVSAGTHRSAGCAERPLRLDPAPSSSLDGCANSVPTIRRRRQSAVPTPSKCRRIDQPPGATEPPDSRSENAPSGQGACLTACWQANHRLPRPIRAGTSPPVRFRTPTGHGQTSNTEREEGGRRKRQL